MKTQCHRTLDICHVAAIAWSKDMPVVDHSYVSVHVYTRGVLREHSEHPAAARKQLLGFSQNKENFDFSHFGKSDIFDIF